MLYTEVRQSLPGRIARPELDEVDDASFDSFPASDPPTWTSMRAGAPRASVEVQSTSEPQHLDRVR
jgi:hypothetical protein